MKRKAFYYPYLLLVFSILLPLILTSCSVGRSESRTCQTDSDCFEGEVCLNQICAARCLSNSDCTGQEVCLNGKCLTDPDTGSPSDDGSISPADDGAVSPEDEGADSPADDGAVSPTYTVIYDGNSNTGGSVPIDPTNYEQGATVTVRGNNGNLVKAGHSFIGWNTQADGLGTNRPAGSTFIMGAANVILYAKWTTNPTYTVTYDGNGNTGGNAPIGPTNYEQGATVMVLGNTGNLEKTGFDFLGWNTKAEANGTTYANGQTFTMATDNVTLYAKWIETDIDGNVYHTVTIGTQIWLVENLKVTRYNNGSAIPNITDNTAWNGSTTAAYCNYDNSEINGSIYGRLYNWYAVNTGLICPTGWHVPSDAEWCIMENTVEAGTDPNCDITGFRGAATGNKLKTIGNGSPPLWADPSIGTNESGFSALPGGYRNSEYDGFFFNLGSGGYWWSAAENGAYALSHHLYSYSAGIFRIDAPKSHGYSVRCVKD